MPITTHPPAPLRNELTPHDFNSVSCNWLYASFRSGYVYPDIDSSHAVCVASFLNQQTRGPYYVHETHNQGQGARGQIMHVILIHPDDRTDFAQQFTAPFWKPLPDSADKNAEILHLQSVRGFVYQNQSMAALMQQLQAVSLPFVWQAVDVDSAARRLWPAPARPAPGSSLPAP